MSLQQKLDTFRADFETKMAPPEVVATFHRAIDDLIASRAAEKALKRGDKAPAFSLPDPDGRMVSLDGLLKRGSVVLTFYRGVWCPYCNLDLEALEAARPEIEARGASLVGISQQTPANSRKAQAKHSLGFPVLSDKGGELGAAFGVRWTFPDYLRDVHRKLGAELPAFNGEDSWTLPMPARYVIAPDRIIVYAEVNPDYTRRPEPSDVFPALDALAAKQGAKAAG
jgi:peroxiredoxin